MANLQLPRASPPEGFSIAFRLMDDAIARYLYKEGAAVARAHIENLASEIIRLYDDGKAAYDYAMAKISETEEQERQRWMREFADFLRPEQKTAQPAERPEPGVLPPKLSTEKAMLMWQRLQQAGYIDDCYQPVGLSRAMLTVIADEMMARIGDENEKLLGFNDKWTHFEILWGKKNLRTDHYHALYKENASDFREKIQLLFADIP